MIKYSVLYRPSTGLLVQWIILPETSCCTIDLHMVGKDDWTLMRWKTLTAQRVTSAGMGMSTMQCTLSPQASKAAKSSMYCSVCRQNADNVAVTSLAVSRPHMILWLSHFLRFLATGTYLGEPQEPWLPLWVNSRIFLNNCSHMNDAINHFASQKNRRIVL